jgi:Predicted integral membrane protein (DUF2270)
MSPPSREQAAAGQTSNQTTALCDRREPALPPSQKLEFNAAEIGALAHLYRGEVYRSTVWRTRLDSTTNWAVVTTGAALSAQYGSIALAHGARRPHRQRVFFSSWKPAVTGISTSGGHAHVCWRPTSTRRDQRGRRAVGRRLGGVAGVVPPSPCPKRRARSCEPPLLRRQRLRAIEASHLQERLSIQNISCSGPTNEKTSSRSIPPKGRKPGQ